MRLLLVTYHLLGDDHDYSGFHRRLDVFRHIRLSDCAVALSAGCEPQRLHGLLRPLLGEGDILRVRTLSSSS